MNQIHKNNPLHGKTLEIILTELVEFYGFEELALYININCFKKNPSIKSSLVFLRKTPWARSKVETLYLNFIEGEDYPKYLEKMTKLMQN